MAIKTLLSGTLALTLLAACGGDSTGPNPGPSLNCGVVPPTTLAAGGVSISDPTAGACVAVPSVPAAGSSGAEYLYVAASTAGQETSTGIAGQYAISGAAVGATADEAPLPSPLLSAFQPPLTAQQFHMMLRRKEREVARDPRAVLFRARVGQAPSLATAAPPAKGDQKSFQVCRNLNCDPPFVTVTATAQHVGQKIAVFVDNASSVTQTYTDPELANVGQLFDNYLYPIDTTNFGHESDIDNNGVVYVLLSPQINKLSGNCNATGSVILGYFYSVDLEPSQTGSNSAELFYSLVPDPLNSTCTISKPFALDNLPPTFIHEFQHMISYGQHVLLKNGNSEDTWLNEGLSHYAEDLGGRLIPDNANPTLGFSATTERQFAFGDYDNAYNYLANPEGTALIESGQSNGQLTERGANWLMARWLAGQFGTTTPNTSQFLVKGTDVTRGLEATNLIGSANVAQQTGQSFSDLVTFWHLANYLDHLPGFTPADPRLAYADMNLRATLAKLNKTPQFPLRPDSTKTGAYQRAGTLQQGSAHHVRIIQASGAQAVQFKLSGTGGGAISATIVPRVGLVRIR